MNAPWRGRSGLRVALLCLFGCGAALLWKDARRPILAIDKPICALGVLVPGQTGKGEVVLRNVGHHDLKIYSVASSCSCAVAVIGSAIIAPGSNTLLRVQVSAPRFSGALEEDILIHSNDRKNPKVNIRVQAVVDPIIEFRPSLADFGVVEKKDLPVQRVITVQATSGRLDPAMILSTDSDFLTGDWDPRETPGRCTLKLTLSKDAPVGPVQGTIWLQTSTVSNHVFSIPVGGKVIGTIRAEPETAYFGIIPRGSEQRQEGRIIDADGKRRYRITILPSAAREYLNAQMLDRVRFEMVVLSNAPPGRLSASARLDSPSDRSAVVEMPILGFVSTNKSQ